MYKIGIGRMATFFKIDIFAMLQIKNYTVQYIVSTLLIFGLYVLLAFGAISAESSSRCRRC